MTSAEVLAYNFGRAYRLLTAAQVRVIDFLIDCGGMFEGTFCAMAAELNDYPSNTRTALIALESQGVVHIDYEWVGEVRHATQIRLPNDWLTKIATASSPCGGLFYPRSL